MQRGVTFLAVIGRLNDGITQTAATSELEVLAGRYREAHPGNADAAWGVSTVGLRDDIVGTSRSSLLTLMAAVGLLLLVACANVANLLLVRFTGRRQEVGLRTALGASRLRIVRQFLVESLLISVAAAGLGALLAYWTLPALVLLANNNLAFAADIQISVPVLIGTAVVALAAGVLMGAYPAVQGSRTDIMATLRDGGRTIAGAAASHRARRLIVAGQVAVSLMLVSGASVLVMSFLHLRGQPTGFDSTNVFIARLNLPTATYPTPEDQGRFWQRTATALAEVPGVRNAVMAQTPPLSGATTRAPYAIAEGAPPLAGRPLGVAQSVTPGFFHTLGIPLIAGRDFTERDTADSPLVVIVSQSAARKLFPHGDAIGHRLVMGAQGGGQTMEIVGIVGDVRSQTLASMADVEFYRSTTQRPRTFMQMVVRTEGDAAAFESSARRVLASIDPTLPLTGVTTLEALLDQSVAQERLLFTLLVVFAGLAVVLSTVGIYGVVAAFVVQRTEEIGVRMALGAGGSEVIRLVLAQTLRPVAHRAGRGRAGLDGERTCGADAAVRGVGARPSTVVAVGQWSGGHRVCGLGRTRLARGAHRSGARLEERMKPRLSHQVKALRDGGGMDRELDAEVRFHIEMETENYIRQGMDPVAARTRAMRNFGPMEKHKEEARDARGVSWFEQLMQDLKYGARTLVKNPGFALLAVLTLGLGIGANTAIFSVINGVLLKPLPYENGDRLVLIQQQTPLARQQNFPRVDHRALRLPAAARELRRHCRIPPDELRPAAARRARSRRHRRRLAQLLRRARHQAGARTHVHRQRR